MEIYSIDNNIEGNIKNNNEDSNLLVKEDRKNYLQMDKIMKRLFTLKNTRPIIDFLNAIYGDSISYKAELSYENTEINNPSLNKKNYITFYADMYISVKDKDKTFQYALEFQTVFENDMAIRVFRYSFERAARNPKYSKNKDCVEVTLPESYLIVLEEEKDLQDYITLKINVPKAEAFSYPIKVLRYWTYDLEKLYNENMYLLYPLQLFKLRKSMERISNSQRDQEYKKNKMLKIYDLLKSTINKTLIAIDKAYYDGKINISDYNEMNIIIDNLNCYFTDMYGKYGDIEEEVRFMVKSFYDPKVEKRGIEKGREDEKIKIARNLLDILDIETISKKTGLSVEIIKKLKLS